MIGDKEQQRSTLVKWRQAGRAGDFLFDDHFDIWGLRGGGFGWGLGGGEGVDI